MKKRILFSLYVLLFSFLLICLNINVSATSLVGTTTYLYNGQYGYTTDSETVYELVDGVSHTINRGTAISDSGKTTNPDRLTHIYKANIKDNDNIKMVEWAVKRDDNGGFIRAGLLDIAKDYEETHPGYVVLCGVNADQFYTGFGTGLGTNGTDYYSPQPYYSYISDGDNLFVYSPYANYSSIVGFKNDDSDVQLEYSERSVKGLYIHVYDKDGSELGSFKATDLNLTDSLGENETTVLSPYKNGDNTLTIVSKTSNNKFYCVNSPELCYVSNSVTWTYKEYNVNAFFGKGYIDEVKDGNVNLSGISFAIETTNKELESLLAKDVYVKCQYEYDDSFSNIEEGCGFHTVQILNGVAQDVANGYNTPNYPRSIFGCDDNGNVYLIVTERSTQPKDGMRAQEINCMMMQYGITNAFQVDGGGSVQSVCRNSEGVLEYAQVPYEGAFRAVLTGTFIVMKVDNISVDITDITNTTANITLKDNENLYTDLAIKVDDGDLIKLNSNEGTIKLSDLTKFTTYNLSIYVYSNGEYRKVYMSKSFTTYKDSPSIDSVQVSLIDDKYHVKIKMIDNDSICLKATMYFGSTKKGLTFSNGECELIFDSVDDLFNVSIELDCAFTTDVRSNLVINNLNIDGDSIVSLNYMKDVIDTFFEFK